MSRKPHMHPVNLDDPFKLWLPLEIEPNRDALFKSAAQLQTDLPDNVLVKGLVSSEMRDLEGELIRQDGIDWTYFLKHGRLTYGHPASNKNVIGTPRTLMKATMANGTPATYLEGNLWLRKPLGLQAYLDHQAALAAGDPGMGYSIEGNATERNHRDPSIVEKAIVYTVAIAFQHINPATALDPITAIQGLAKALGVSPSDIPAFDEGTDIADAIKSLIGIFAPAIFKSKPEMSPARRSLLAGISDDELRALRFLRKNPDITFSDAACLAQSYKQGFRP